MKSVSRLSGGVREIGRNEQAESPVTESPKMPASKSRRSQTAPRTARASSTTTRPIAPKPSEPLFSISDFTVRAPKQLRTLMHESLQGLLLSVASRWLQVCSRMRMIQQCESKSERVLNRAASRHGSQERFVILGGQKQCHSCLTRMALPRNLFGICAA